MRIRRTFTADPHSVRAARRFATEALPGCGADVRESVELMVSELATNGIRHGRTNFRVMIEQTPEEIRVAVTDGGAGTPQMQFPGPDEPTGRGLRIVDMLSERWGVERDTWKGKTVWFTVSIAAEQSATGADAAGRAGSGGLIRGSREPSAWTFLVGRVGARQSSGTAWCVPTTRRKLVLP